MRRLTMFSAGLTLCIMQTLPVFSQRMLNTGRANPVICYQSFEDRHDHIGVSEKVKGLRQAGAGRTKTATIEVEYINFPANDLAKNAFQFAVDIWETELVSSVPIRIRADWRVLSPGVLGQALWGSAHANFGGEQFQNTFYPVALAEKISGKEINASNEPDIVASFNSNASWYFGTNGETPAGKMDMVTIVLHEIAHGLGFTDTYDVNGTQGSVGLFSGGSPVPFIFDVFIVNATNKNLVQEFQSPSPELATQLQSSNLFFASPLTLAALDGIRPEIYAPASFDNGSSISHLDESTFNSSQDANRLMTPQIAFAESIHNPGEVLMAALADMGWVYTQIGHEPLKDTERKNGAPYVVKVKINSDNGYDPTTVKLNYSSDGTNFTVVNMAPTGVQDEYTFPLPGTTVNKAYLYFISVTDNDDRIFTNPGKTLEINSTPEQGFHFFRIGPDTTSPEILHDPVKFVGENSDELNLTAEVTDNLGVGEVVAEYFINSGPVQTIVMQRSGTTDSFSGTILLPALSPEDEIHYRLIARDLAGSENVAMDPEEEYHVVDVTGMLPVRDSYVNNFDSPSSDFFGERFGILNPPGFNNGAIHSDHPYENGIGPDDQSNYTYQLQIPIRISDISPWIRFDEIVLVEPGEDGSVFGDDGFYDYVVVEGSTDAGQTWKVFAPGYDARANGVWLTRYNSDIDDDNSESQGEPDLFRSRSINMLENGNFSVGDEVLVRFRLFADQFAHGWGWAIDNLAIQAPVTAIEKPDNSDLKVYPVPARSELRVELGSMRTNRIGIRIADAMGRIVYDKWIDHESPGSSPEVIDVKFLSDGLYVLEVRTGKNCFTRKFNKLSE